MNAPAPLYAEIADAPAGGCAYRTTTSDGTGIRFAVWEGGKRGTFLILPGRTEYIEKYGRVVDALSARGYSCVAIDWRGQGLSDRPSPDPFIGHVRKFDEYQKDLQAVLDQHIVKNLPEPRLMLAHSMGGCIGYRAIQAGLEVDAAIFSAPMWGLKISPVRKPLAHILSSIIPKLSRGPVYAPGGDRVPYISKTPFEDNVLTGDRAYYDWMLTHLAAHPELGLGGPSYSWLGAALSDMARAHAAPPADTKSLIFVGTEELVVSSTAIQHLSRRLPNAELIVLENARHEVLIETPALQARVWDAVDRFLSAMEARPTPPS